MRLGAKRRAWLTCVVFVAACHEPTVVAPPPLPTAPDPPSTAAEVDAAPPAPFAPEKVSVEGRAMGTHLTFAAFTTPRVDAGKTRAAFAAAIKEIQRVEGLMTTWRDSELTRINAAAGKSAVAVSEETFAIIKESVHASSISEGTFDITFHTLHGLWKFDEDLDPHPPTKAQIAERLPFVGWKNIELDAEKRTVKLAKARTQIGLGGIAKGYAVDRAAKVLLDAGLDAFFVQAGGDLLARGKKPDGSDWQAGIRDPRGADGKFFAVLSLADHAFSTAGDYERSYIVDNKRYHHIIDPRTGMPATACRSVTIWAPTALLADEIDDAVFILGPDKGMKLVESIDGVGAVIVDAKNNVWVSKRLKDKIILTSAPSDGI